MEVKQERDSGDEGDRNAESADPWSGPPDYPVDVWVPDIKEECAQSQAASALGSLLACGMAPKRNYTSLQMGQAIEAVKKGAKIATAAKKFGVPRVTLYNKISGKTPVECSMGPKTYLSTEEEALLEKWILEMAEKHIPISRDELLDSVQRMIIDQKKISPFTDNRPGRKWYNLFLNRHPTLTERTAQKIMTDRDAVTEDDIKRWFEEVESYLRGKNLSQLLEEPARIFNTDESAFFLSPKIGKVLAKKGDKHNYQSSGDENDNLTVSITGNAAGQLAPPMVVFTYERISSSISSQFPEGWAIGRSQSGWMCGSTFYEYIANIFNPWLIQQHIEKPIVFFLDGHRSHLTLHLSNFCAENGIEIIALHPNSTHILQPMDLAIFKPLKIYWREAVEDWKLQNFGQNLKKENFAPVLKTALQSITENCIKNGFRAGGLYPLGPDYVELTKIKSRQKPEKVSTKRTLFFNYLENEIVAKLGAEKLQLFNELFYKGRDELNSRLNQEDLSLYIIWAGNKHTVERSVHVNEPSAIQSDVGLIQADISIQAEIRDHSYANAVTLNEITASNNSASNILASLTGGQEAKETTNNTTIIDEPRHSNITDSVPITSISRSSTNILNINAATEFTTTKETIRSEPKEKSSSALIVKKPSSSNQVMNLLQLPSTSSTCIQSAVEKTPFKEMTKPGTSKSIPKKLGHIPSPFKRNLFWPGEEDDKKGEKRKLNEKIPCAITSKLWRDYHERKEEEKIRKEKEIRAKEKEKRRQLKQKEIANKKQKRLRGKENKKMKRNTTSNPKLNDTSSDNTDTEVNYAESEDCYNMEIYEEITDSEQVTEKDEKSDNSESEDVPLSRFSKPPITNAIGDYVIITYKGEFFPGIIENIHGNKFEISTMKFSVGNTFKWPEKEDKIWYQKSDIVRAISKPVLCNKRGFYTIPEMKEYLPFTM